MATELDGVGTCDLRPPETSTLPPFKAWAGRDRKPVFAPSAAGYAVPMTDSQTPETKPPLEPAGASVSRTNDKHASEG